MNAKRESFSDIPKTAIMSGPNKAPRIRQEKVAVLKRRNSIKRL